MALESDVRSECVLHTATMAMVLSTQSRLLVVLCGSLLVLAGALAVGSFTGWFHTQRMHDPMPARLRQVLLFFLATL